MRSNLSFQRSTSCPLTSTLDPATPRCKPS
jgi:hypothetical protein